MVTRGRGEERRTLCKWTRTLQPTISMFHCRTHTWDVDERERRREEIGWQREGEENLIPIDKDIFNPLSLYCRTHTWDGD